ncbi:MAG: hypothetical protein AAFV71_27870 [Cyanobacteria bacterium J06633_8]
MQDQDFQERINKTFIESIGTLTAQLKQLHQKIEQQQQQINQQQQEIEKLNNRLKAVKAATVLGDDAPEDVILENVELLKDCAWSVEEGHRAYACIIGLVDDWKPLFKKQVWGYLNEQDKAKIKQLKAEYEQYQQQIIDYEKHQQNLNFVESNANKSFEKPALTEETGLIDWNKLREKTNKKKAGFGAVKVEDSPQQPQKKMGFGAVKTVSATETIDGFGAA